MHSHHTLPVLPLTPPRSSPILHIAPNFESFFFSLIQRIQFVLLIHSWVWVHPLECCQPVRGRTLKNTNSLSLVSHLLSTGPQPGVGLRCLFLLYTRVLTCLILWRNCAGNHSCYEFMGTMVLSCTEDMGCL